MQKTLSKLSVGTCIYIVIAHSAVQNTAVSSAFISWYFILLSHILSLNRIITCKYNHKHTQNKS